jgi:hypothetical protein
LTDTSKGNTITPEEVRHGPAHPGDFSSQPDIHSSGKAKKVALVTFMEKLLTILNAMLTHRMRLRTEQSQHA